METHLRMLLNWRTTLSGKERCFLLYSEDQLVSGTRTILPTQQPGRMFEQISSLDFQMDETNLDTERKWNNILEEMEKKIRNLIDPIQRTVDKGWLDDLNGIETAHHNAEREAQGRQRRQRYIDNSLQGLRPRYL